MSGVKAGVDCKSDKPRKAKGLKHASENEAFTFRIFLLPRPEGAKREDNHGSNDLLKAAEDNQVPAEVHYFVLTQENGSLGGTQSERVVSQFPKTVLEPVNSAQIIRAAHEIKCGVELIL